MSLVFLFRLQPLMHFGIGYSTVSQVFVSPLTRRKL
jgi:hypothetical protein